MSRRRLLGVAGAGALAVGAGVGGFAVGRAEADSPGAPGDATYPFNGEHQAGILTPTQDRLHFAAFDVTTDSRAELVALLKAWTDCGGRDDGRHDGRGRRSPALRQPACRHRRGARALRRRADPDLRLRTDPVREGRQGPVRAQGPPAEVASRSCRTSRPTTSTRRAATGTSASRPAPTTPRSPYTPSATWPGSASAPSRSAGRSSASGGRRPPRRSRRPHATCSASRTAPAT